MTYKDIEKRFSLEVGNQYIVEIPNVGRDDLAQMFGEFGLNKGAEIGVDKGEYSEVLCNANPNLELFGIDPYMLSAYEKRINPKEAGIHDTQEGFEGNFDVAQKRLSRFSKYTFIRKPSLEALDDFDDESLDFVYIDANHDFPNFINDLHEWLKKVKTGGIMSGHDYANFSYRKFNHVKRALDAYARCYHMIPLFIVGSEEKADGVKRDRFRSWFWIKQ